MRQISWTGNIASISKMRNVSIILVAKPQIKRLSKIRGLSRYINIIMSFKTGKPGLELL
jgi:hypothetical protein